MPQLDDCDYDNDDNDDALQLNLRFNSLAKTHLRWQWEIVRGQK